MPTDALLAEQRAYYEAIAGEYEQHGIDAPGGDALERAFAAFDLRGDVLDLACGSGVWTQHLVTRAASVTAVDASDAMLAIARDRVGGAPVTFEKADLFEWKPTRRYDSIFFGFWLSHVPSERFESFWQMIGQALAPHGSVFFVDDNHRGDNELVHGEDSPVVQRTLLDGTAFHAVKVPWQADALAARLRSLGWAFEISSSGPFYWGSGAPIA